MNPFRPLPCALLAAAALAAASSEARAQVCLGDPSQERGGSLSGMAQFNGGPTSYGGNFRGNLAGPLSIGATFMITDLEDVDEDIYTFGGSLAYDIAVDVREFSICPTAGVQYSRWDDELAGVEASRSEFRFPVGIGAGVELGDRDRVAVIPAIAGGWFYFTERDALEGEDVELARDDSGGEFFGAGSATLVMGPFFARGAVMTDEWRVDDPVYNVSVGISF